MPLLFRDRRFFLEAINGLCVLQVLLLVVMAIEDVCQGAVHISYSHAGC
jgi:hypothetical protein